MALKGNSKNLSWADMIKEGNNLLQPGKSKDYSKVTYFLQKSLWNSLAISYDFFKYQSQQKLTILFLTLLAEVTVFCTYPKFSILLDTDTLSAQ